MTDAATDPPADNVVRFPSNGRPVADRADSTPSPKEAIGSVLREERQTQGRTLADVADRAAVSLPYLSEVERGRKDVSSEVLVAIAEALELPIPEVFERAAGRLRTRFERMGNLGMHLLAA